MNIVHINAIYGTGSTGGIIADLVRLCRVRNNKVCAVYSENSFLKDGYKIGNWVDRKIHSLFTRISGKQGYFSHIPTMVLLKYLTKFRPDIVHLHNLHGSYINIPLLLRYLAEKRIATVITLHDCWFYTGGCSHYTSVGCMKWKNECGNCPRRYEEFPAYVWDSSRKQLIDRKKLFGNIQNLSVVGVSNWITSEARQNVFKDANCITIHNGIDTEFFHPIDDNEFRRKYHLENKWFMPVNKETLSIFLGRLTDDMAIVFIGKGANRDVFSDKIINLGFISSREEIREIYSAVDVMINCTREESLSLLNVEVQACGTPVVTYANTGVKETVDGECGFAVENGNPEALWEKMMEIKRNGKYIYSEKCIEWVNKKFDKNKNYLKYVELYRTIVN